MDELLKRCVLQGTGSAGMSCAVASVQCALPCAVKACCSNLASLSPGSLRRFEPFAGVSFYWIMFGSSGYKQSPQGWVTRSYLK